MMSEPIMSEAMKSEAMGLTPAERMSTRDVTFEKDMMCVGGNMKDDELDRMLSKQGDIQPSSGFAASVMEAVRNEAAAPPPIPFPWKRALPVLLLAAVTLIVVVAVGVEAVVNVTRGAAASELAPSSWSLFLPLAQGGIGTQVSWTAAALLGAFLSVKLSMRLASGRG
jgi:hypothetical protein